jgi:hypothetical protein
MIQQTPFGVPNATFALRRMSEPQCEKEKPTIRSATPKSRNHAENSQSAKLVTETEF